jgi:translocator protein
MIVSYFLNRIPERSNLNTSYKVVSLIGWIGLCFLTAWIGSRFAPGEWYVQLQKPSWTPPGYLFGPVWSLLFLSMGIAAWLVWKRAGVLGARLALSLFLVQLVLNGMWSWIFFGMREPGLAFAEILILWGAILVTLIAFWQKSAPAGILLIPYLAWVSFASILNFSIWQMNKGC